jgi:hypothetical protein
VLGQGSAMVSPGSSVHLQLTVRPEGGGKGAPVDVTLPLGANNRYSGDGTVLGKPAHFEGRLDVPDDDKERLLRGVRLVCRFHTTDDPQAVRYASVIGYIPALADARDRIDSGGDDDGGGKGNGSGNGNGNGNGNGGGS